MILIRYLIGTLLCACGMFAAATNVTATLRTVTVDSNAFTMGRIPYATGNSRLTNSFLVYTNGNLGIGTTEPQQALHVIGGIRFEMGGYASDITHTSNNLIIAGNLLASNLLSYVAPANVKAYGAVGNGTTDDSAAVQSAMTASPSVYFPDGTYLVSSLSLSADAHLYGTGTLKANTNSTAPMIVSTNTLRITDLTFDGNKAGFGTNYDQPNVGLYLIISHTPSVAEDKLIIESVTFNNATKVAVLAKGNLEIRNSTFKDQATHTSVDGGGNGPTFAVYGFPVFTNTLATFANNRVENTLTGDFTNHIFNAIAFFVTEGTDGSGNLQRYDKVVARDNTFVGSRTGVHTYNAARDVVVSGNKMKVFWEGGIKIQRTDNAVISGNLLEGDSLASEAGIRYDPQAREGSSPFTGGRAGEKHYNCIIDGNILHNVTGYGIIAAGERTRVANNILDGSNTNHLGFGNSVGIVVTDDDVDVVGNVMFNVRCNPIGVLNVDNVSLRDNYLSLTSLTGGYGIYALGADNLVVKGNRITYDTAPALVYAIGVFSNNNTRISGNTLTSTDADTFAVYLKDATNAVVTDNVFNGDGTSLKGEAFIDLIAERNFMAMTTNQYFVSGYTGTIRQVGNSSGVTWAVTGETSAVTALHVNAQYGNVGIGGSANTSTNYPLLIDRTFNGIGQVFHRNLATAGNTSAAASVSVGTRSSSGLWIAYPDDYADSTLQDRVAIIAESNAAGLTLRANSWSQTLNIDTTGISINTLSTVTTTNIIYTTGSDGTGIVTNTIGVNKGFITSWTQTGP